MFWNLVRYEFKNVNKWYLALYGAVLALSASSVLSLNSLMHCIIYTNPSPVVSKTISPFRKATAIKACTRPWSVQRNR